MIYTVRLIDLLMQNDHSRYTKSNFERLNFISFYFLRPWPEFGSMLPPCWYSAVPNGGVPPPSAPGTPGATLGHGEGAKTADGGLGLTPTPH